MKNSHIKIMPDNSEHKSKYDPSTVTLTEPLKSIVEWIEDIEKKHNLLDKRVIRFERLMIEIRGKLSKVGIEIKDITRI